MIKMFSRVQSNKRGFTLIELAIVLAVTSLLTAGLWRMMSSGNTQLRDQASADQQRELINAIKGYLASEQGQTRLRDSLVDGSTFNVPLDCPAGPPDFTKLCDYLPDGFSATDTKNSYGQGYEVQVRRTVSGGSLTSYSFMIQTNGGDAIPDTSGGRISSMIGNDGGFVYSIAACSQPACGAFGTWMASPTVDYGFAANNTGHVATRTFIGMNAELNAPWLARVRMQQHDSNADGIDDLNTFNDDTVETAMNGSTFYGGLKPDPTAPTTTYAGKFLDLNQVDIGANLKEEATAPLVVHSGEMCSKNTPDEAGCQNALEVSGDASVSGLLSANKLFAAQFIYRESSDIRLKKELEQISNPLEKLGMIKGYSYRMENEKNKKYGVIAQEVEKAFPELVSEMSGYKGVDYIGLIGPLVASVNELKRENDQLKKQIEEQSKSIDLLKGKAAK